jgi:hypothetical protein
MFYLVKAHSFREMVVYFLYHMNIDALILCLLALMHCTLNY